ncbi:unnamed protein product [Symbiodinium sp. CCMP2592]|nr:unnamed protein product [Symbiodinium sp. CCMP2592]
MALSRPLSAASSPSVSPDLMAQRWGWLEQGMPPVEHAECRRLMVKAIMAGESEQIMNESLNEFRALRSRLQANGEWTIVLDYYGRGPGPQARKRACEDQSSRAVVENDMDEDPTDDWARVSEVDSLDFDELFAFPTPENDRPAPPPKAMNRKEKNKAPASTSSMPPDVSDLEQWGHTVIEFGKFKNSNMSYFELATSDTKEMNSYKVWVVSHLGQTTGQCKDLGEYLKAFTEAGLMKKHVVIPGTSLVRKYKASSSTSSGSNNVGPTTLRRK